MNRYIGVTGGYLGDFSYRTHADFYPEYCDLLIDPYAYEGTTRERFIEILSSLPAADQAKVLRGVLQRFRVGEGPATRDEAMRDDIDMMIRRLEDDTLISSTDPRVSSEVVQRALRDAEVLITTSGAVSAIDRIHTALHGYLLAVCKDASLSVEKDASMTSLFKKLRVGHPKLRMSGPQSQEIVKVLQACATILDAMNPVRNRASVAHPNSELLGNDEARLVINVTRTLLAYLDAKLAL